MSHGVDTSRRHYQNIQRDYNSVRAFTLIRDSNTEPADLEQATVESAGPPPSKQMRFSNSQTELVTKYFNLTASSTAPSVADIKEFCATHKDEIGGRSIDQIREKTKSIIKSLRKQ